MRVVQYKSYLNAYRALVELGGQDGQRVKKAAVVLNNLEAGLPPGVQTTDHGETRIRNCVKFNLGDGFRLITLQEGDTCLALYVGNHDACQAWLSQNAGIKLSFKPETQEVVLINAPETASRGDLRTGTPTLDHRPYFKRIDGVNWTALIEDTGFRFGLLALNENHTEEEQWELLAELQAQDASLGSAVIAALNHVKRCEYSEAVAVIEAYQGSRVVASDTIPIESIVTDEVLALPVNAERFVHLNPLSEAERKLMEDPTRFEEWMVFLHPGQRRVVDEDFDKQAVLTGVSGSGKTCVLVHRARRLARCYPDKRILVLTLNRSLARLLENLIKRLCVDGEHERVDVRSFHDYLASLLASLDLTKFLELLGTYTNHGEAIRNLLEATPPDRLEDLFKSLDERVLKGIFGEFTDQLTGPARDNYNNLEVYLYSQDQSLSLSDYIYEELELIRSAFRCYEEYTAYRDGFEREGRSIQFQTERREQVLSLLHDWEGYQIRRRFLDHMGLCQAAMLAVEEMASIPALFRYRAVLVDEFQDFSTLDLQLLARVPTDTQNGLFLTGDLAQKLYAKELDLNKAKIGPTDRVLRSIRKNYRNSRQILMAADRLLKVFPPPSSSGDSELKVLDPELAERDSAKPIAFKASNPVAQAWREVQGWLRAGHKSFSVCIASANLDAVSLDKIRQACPPGIKVSDLSGDYFLDPSAVVISDIATIKGFEFSLIIILGLEDGAFPLKGRPHDEQWRDALRLYVAITRGRDEVRFIYSGSPSPFLEAMGDSLSWREKAEPATVAAQFEVSRPPEEAAPVNEEIPEKDNDTRLLVEFANGFAIATVPHGISERRLATALGKPAIEIALRIQQQGTFIAPDRPLEDHIVRSVCQTLGVLVAFAGPERVVRERNP